MCANFAPPLLWDIMISENLHLFKSYWEITKQKNTTSSPADPAESPRVLNKLWHYSSCVLSDFVWSSTAAVTSSQGPGIDSGTLLWATRTLQCLGDQKSASGWLFPHCSLCAVLTFTAWCEIFDTSNWKVERDWKSVRKMTCERPRIESKYVALW